MKLNHLDLQVSDVHKARVFFETHFGLRCTYTKHSEITLLEDDDGFSFGLSNLKGRKEPPVYPSDFHFGFVLKDTDQLKAIYEQIKNAGVSMHFDLQQGGPNLYFVCLGPDHIPVEVRAPIQTRDNNA